MKKILLILLSFALLSACASQANWREQMVSLAKLSPDKKINAIRISSANNAISDGMILASLATGSESNGVLALINALSIANVQLAVVGDNQAINVASLKNALKKIQATDNATVYIYADEQQKNELMPLAQAKNVRLIVHSEKK